MALALLASTGNGVMRSTGIAPASGDYTCCFWLKPTDTTGAPAFLTVNGVATYTKFAAIYTTGSSLIYELDINGTDQTTTATVQQGMYTPMAYTRAGTTHSFYCHGVLIGTVTVDVSADTYTETWIGNDTGNEAVTDHTQYVREWTEALTLAELIDEWNSPTPVRTADLFTDTPLGNDYLDDSGNGHDWSVVSTPVPSFVTGAVPVPLTNTGTDATAAYDVGSVLPAAFVQVVRDAAGATAQRVWFTYTAQANDVEIGAWGFGTPSVYTANGSVYDGGAGAPNELLTNGLMRPQQVAVTSGSPYYFRFLRVQATPAYAVLNFSIYRGPNETVPTGSILINDSTAGFPLVMIDSATGDVLAFTSPFPAGECCNVLTTGEVMVEDAFGIFVSANNPAIIGTDLALLDAPTMPDDDYVIFGTDQATGWWAGRQRQGGGDHSTAVFVSKLGVVSGTVHDFGALDLKGLSPNLANTKIYFISNSANVNHPVRVLDVGTDVVTTFIAADATAILKRKMVTMLDDTLLVGYSVSGTNEVRRFDTGGSVTDTYTIGAGNSIECIFPAADDPVSFWVWYIPTSPIAENHYRNILVADGSTIVDLTTDMFVEGTWQGTATVDPPSFFGSDFSCEPWITRTGITPPPPTPSVTPPYHLLTMGEPTYLDSEGNPHLNPLQEPRLRRSPHVNTDKHRIFAKLFELDLQPGIGLVDGQGSDPIVMLRVSRDGGQTWSQERQMHVGGIGQYTKRCRALQLGSGRDLVFEVRVSDPNRWQISAAYLEAEQGTN